MVTGERRQTSQRAVLMATLADCDEFVSAQELHTILSTAGARIGLATIYRILADMVAAGDIDTVRGTAGETRYRHCAATTHHHHLVCRRCGRTEDVAAPAVERWTRTLADTYGFIDLDHEIELYGLCAECAAAPQRTSR